MNIKFWQPEKQYIQRSLVPGVNSNNRSEKIFSFLYHFAGGVLAGIGLFLAVETASIMLFGGEFHYNVVNKEGWLFPVVYYVHLLFL